MTGKPEKSGPPNNENARSNRGGQPGRSGPPANTNPQKHGVWTWLHRGELPADVQPHVDGFARRLDAEIADRYPDGPPFEVECLRETAISDYAVAHLRARYAGSSGLKPDERDKLMHGFLQALDKRDQKVREMNLQPEDDRQSLITALYGQPAQGPETAPDGTTDRDDGQPPPDPGEAPEAESGSKKGTE